VSFEGGKREKRAHFLLFRYEKSCGGSRGVCILYMSPWGWGGKRERRLKRKGVVVWGGGKQLKWESGKGDNPRLLSRAQVGQGKGPRTLSALPG